MNVGRDNASSTLLLMPNVSVRFCFPAGRNHTPNRQFSPVFQEVEERIF